MNSRAPKSRTVVFAAIWASVIPTAMLAQTQDDPCNALCVRSLVEKFDEETKNALALCEAIEACSLRRPFGSMFDDFLDGLPLAVFPPPDFSLDGIILLPDETGMPEPDSVS